MHTHEFFRDFAGFIPVDVAGIEFACWSLRRNCGVGRLLDDVGSLGLFVFVRLLVHVGTVRGWSEGVNGPGPGGRGRERERERMGFPQLAGRLRLLG